MIPPTRLREQARQYRKANKKLANRLRRLRPRELDAHFHEQHHEAFERIDCLDCANCCKTTSPIVRDVDIERLARRLRLRPAELVDQYLRLDEDQDYVFRSAPCPFLGIDNRCSVYSDRPKACRDYPHTDRKNMHQLLDLSIRNTAVCPAVAYIFEQLRGKL